MDFTLSTEQTLLCETVRAYCRDKYRFHDRQRVIAAGGFLREHWEAFASLGWLGVLLPEDIGGTSGSAVELAIVMEEFGRALVLEPFLPCAVLAGEVVNRAAPPEMRRALLGAIVNGEQLVAVAHGETDAGGEIEFVDTRAVRRGSDGYVVTGRKTGVLGGAVADHLVVSARRSGAPTEPRGTMLCLMPAAAAGIERRLYHTIDGAPVADFAFHDVLVADRAVLVHDEPACAALASATDLAVVGLCAEAVGAMETVAAVTRDYLKTRRAFGTTLSSFQALQHRVADMLVDLELSRSILHRALAGLESPDRTTRNRAVSAAKALIGRSGRFVGSSGIQLHGGMGMSDDYIVGHLYKRLLAIETQFGNSDSHLERVASGVAGVQPGTAELDARLLRA